MDPVEVRKWVQNGLCLAYDQSGKPIFLHGAIPGEIVTYQILQEKSKHSFGMVHQVIQPSPDRVESDCKAYPECGGCSFRHISYSNEIELKINLLNELKNINIPSQSLNFISSPPDSYRTRVRIHSKNGSFGFYKYRTNEIIQIPDDGCRQLEPELNRYIHSNSAFEEAQNIQIQRRFEKNYKLTRGFSWQPAEDGFFQANRFLIIPWLEKITELVNKNQPYRHVIELFAGSGLIGQFCLMENFESYTGYENHMPSVLKARMNAKHRKHFKFKQADLYSPQFELSNADLIIANPPRSGLGRLVNQIARHTAKRMIYSSCNPHTLDRDAGILKKGGWQQGEITVFDFFPRTPHIEMVVEWNRD